ncbi:MAG: hypothetical protein ABL883_06130 [Terricaulis sp.]
MRIPALIAVALALAACASGPSAGEAGEEMPSPFPVARGSLSAPPPETSGHTAPPEGVAVGGVDFGAWRSADPAVYAPAFAAQMRRRFAGRPAAAIKAELEGNGFVCSEGARLDCRVEIMERQCAHDWYVVLERGAAEPAAGFDVMCLGAR